MARTVEAALSGGDPEGAKAKIRELYDGLLPGKPGAYLYKNLKPFIACRKPSAKTASPANIQAEMAEEETVYRNEPGDMERLMAKACPGYKWRWVEPNDPAIRGYLSVAGQPSAYVQNTFISLYRESREKGTSIHQLCRERGLKYDLLLLGDGKGERNG